MDKNALYPIYGIIYVPFWQTKIFYVISFIFCLLIVFFTGLFLFKRYKLSRSFKKPAWDIALEELLQIKKQLEKKEILGKTFYFRLTWVFKRYLSDMYRFDVYGKTDEELLLYIEGSGLDQELVQDLRSIFEGNVTVKFANERAASEMMNRDLSASINFIEKTIPTKK